MQLSDWLEHWARLVDGPEPTSEGYRRRELGKKDWWSGDRAKRFDDLTKDRQERVAVLEDVLRHVDAGGTMLDIGAGTGAYAVQFAHRVRHVTALDPSSGMLDFLRAHAQEEGLSNITCIESRWEDAEVEPHDVLFCSHAMYASKALDQFLLKMDRVSWRACFLLARVGNLNEELRRAWTAIRGGERLPDPDYLPVYNILYHIGIFANVRIIPTTLSWPFANLEDAVSFCLDYLRMDDTPEHRAWVRDYLAPRVQEIDGRLALPPTQGNVALIWWTKG